jgi:hypothetical protein
MFEIRLRSSRAAEIAEGSLETARRYDYVYVNDNEVLEHLVNITQGDNEVCFVREDQRGRVTFTPEEMRIAIRDGIEVRPSC